ncbi:MAG: hypothetical protein RL442_197 [Pseudomonadota bacterium]
MPRQRGPASDHRVVARGQAFADAGRSLAGGLFERPPVQTGRYSHCTGAAGSQAGLDAGAGPDGSPVDIAYSKYLPMVDDWVLGEVCRILTGQGAPLLTIPDFRLSVNVSPPIISSKGYPSRVLQEIRKQGLSPDESTHVRSIQTRQSASPHLLSVQTLHPPLFTPFYCYRVLGICVQSWGKHLRIFF